MKTCNAYPEGPRRLIVILRDAFLAHASRKLSIKKLKTPKKKRPDNNNKPKGRE